MLWVGLHTDPSIDRPEKNKPVQSTFERFMQLDACKYVDYVIPYDTEHDLTNLLATLDFNVRFLGSDYEGKNFTAKDLCEKRGIRIHYIPRLHDYSSTELRKRCGRQSF